MKLLQRKSTFRPIDFREKVNQMRKIVFIMLEDPSSSKLALFISYIIGFAIFLSQVQIICDSLFDDNTSYNEFSNDCEIIIFIIFALEYFSRICTYTVYGYSLKNFFFEQTNIIDLLSIAPLSIISIIYGRTELNGLRILKLFKVIRVLKMKRYLKGVDILYKSVADSIAQFYFLIIAFLVITLAYAIVLYYSELKDQDLSFYNAVWLGVVTTTTTGYGDYVPKSIIGMIVTCCMALMTNTVIFSLPVAILNIEFHELYGSKKEEEKITQLKLQMRTGKRRDSVKNKEFSFFNQRLQIIEERNKEIQLLLDKSNKMAKDLTKDLKRLFLSVNNEADQLVDNLNSPRLTTQNVLLVKANLYDKLMRAKKKIQITNIFRNLKDSDQEINESPLNQSCSAQVNKKGFFRMMSDRRSAKKKIAMKSHSTGNINQLLVLRNEESGELPFEFLNEVILQIHEDMLIEIDDQNKPFQKRSFILPESSDVMNRESFKVNSLCFSGFESPINRQNMSNSFSPKHFHKQSDQTTLQDKKTILNLKRVSVNPFQFMDSGQRSITEISKSKKKDSYTQKQIEEIHQKTKPKTPHQFVNETNDLKEIDAKSLISNQGQRKNTLGTTVIQHRVYSQFQTFGQSQELENILKNNNPTLEELLERDNFLFDIKAGAMNAFAEYVLKQPDQLEKMIQIIINTNEQIEDTEKGRKFPYIVSEIFALESPRLLDLFFTKSISSLSNERLTTIEDDIQPEYYHEDQCKEEEDQNSQPGLSGTSIQCTSFKSKSGVFLNENVRLQILSTLFRYLDKPLINDTSIGYYAKILLPLAKKYGGEFWDHIMVNNNIISDMIQHINHYQIVEVVVQLLILDTKINDNIIINYKCYNFRKSLLDEMIQQMDRSCDNLTMVQDITQIFDLLLEHGIQNKIYEHLKDLYDYLLKPLYFFKIAKKTQLVGVYKVFYKTLSLIQSNQLQDQKTADLVQVVQQIVSVINANIESESNSNFGKKNLLLVQALAVCDKLNNPLIFESMFQAQIYKFLIEKAISFQWNNQLQISVQAIIQSRFQDERYCQRIIKETDLLLLFKQKLLDSPHNLSYKYRCSHGCNGFLKAIAFQVLEKYNKNKKINQSLIELYAPLMESLQSLQKIESQYLCDVDPKTHMQEAPPEISIDRQIEMIIDAQKEKDEQSQKQES